MSTLNKWRSVTLTVSICGVCVATVLVCLLGNSQHTGANPGWKPVNYNGGNLIDRIEAFRSEKNKDLDELAAERPATIQNEDEMYQNTHLQSTHVSEEPDVTNNSNKTTTNRTDHLPCHNEIKHIGFVKVHKAGSTTMMNILQRFAYMKELLIALPKVGNGLRKLTNLVHIPHDRKFDMIINHVNYYNRDQFEKILASDSKYIGIVRDPLEVTMSAFEYYSSVYHKYKSVRGENRLVKYLQNRERYEPSSAGHSFTNNRMSYDFGLKQEYFHNPDKISEFLEKLNSEMDFVLVLERFTESLILLKRKFCWHIKDILYLTRNKNKAKTTVTFTPDQLAYHRNFSLADNMLYDYFTKRLQEHLAKFDQNSFQEEVEYFKSLLTQVSEYCQKLILNGFVSDDVHLLIIDQSPFNDKFNVSSQDCRLMSYNELAFCDVSRLKQKEILSQVA